MNAETLGEWLRAGLELLALVAVVAFIGMVCLVWHVERFGW